MKHSIVMKKTRDIIKQNNSIVLFMNINSRATVVLACNENLQIDCSVILKSVLNKFGGKGGGKVNFAMGSVEIEKAEEMFNALRKELNW